MWALRYVASPQELHGADVIILPGSKTTIEDLGYLRKTGFEDALMAHVRRGGEMIGVCGGFQMSRKHDYRPTAGRNGGGVERLRVA